MNGIQMKRRRESQGILQVDLARQAEICQSSISRYEHTSTGLSKEVRDRITRILQKGSEKVASNGHDGVLLLYLPNGTVTDVTELRGILRDVLSALSVDRIRLEGPQVEKPYRSKQ